MSQEKEKTRRKRNVVNKTVPFRKDDEIDRMILEHIERKNTSFASYVRMVLWHQIQMERLLEQRVNMNQQ